MADLTINDRIFGDIPAKNAVCTPYIYGSANQEGVGSITFGRHVSNRLKIIYLEFWCRELSIGIYMGPIGGGEGGEGGGAQSFLDPPSKNLRSLLRNFKYIIWIPSSSSVDWDPFWAIWVKGGVCGHVQKSEAHALGCRPRGESSQWSNNLPQTYRIVPAWDSQWKSEKMEAYFG